MKLDNPKAVNLNLIPESERTTGGSKTTPFAVVFVAIIILVAGVCAWVFFQKQGVQKQADDLQIQLAAENAQWQKVASSSAQITAVKTKLTAYETFKTNFPSPTTFIDIIKNHLPTPVTLVQLDVDNVGKASIQVKVPSSADAYELLTELQKGSNFSDVVLFSINKDADTTAYTVIFNLTVKK